MSDLAIFLGSDESALTVLADALNRAMDASPAARAAYLALYGEKWASLGSGTAKSYAPSTEAVTKH